MSSDGRDNIEAIWDAQEARLLTRGLALLLVLFGLPVGAGYFYFAGADFGNGFGFCMAAVGGLSLLALWRGKVSLAFSVLIWGFWALLLFWGFLVFGTRTPVLAGIPALIMLTGWLLGKRSALLMTLMSIPVLVLMFGLDKAGLLAMRPRQAVDFFIAYLVIFPMAGYVAGYFGRSFRDQFDKLRETRQLLQTRVDALRHSEERFSLLFRANPVPSLMARTADGMICEVNPAWESAFGWTAEEVCGKTSVEIGFWPSAQARQRCVDMYWQKREMIAEPFELGHKDGSLHTYFMSLTVTEVGGEQRTIASMLDQTERFRAEAAVKELNATLEEQVAQRTAALSQALETLKGAQAGLLESERLASLGSLVAGVSHELNTPIGNALTVASTLQEKTRQVNRLVAEGQLKKSVLLDFLGSAGEMSDLICRSCHRSSDLIESFKQIAVDQTTEQRRRFELHTLVDDVLTTLRPSFKKMPWVVSADVPEGIACDSFPGPLVQVLTNLIQNAFIHAFDGREAGEVVVVARLNCKGRVRLVVRDNGRGMEAATRKRIFDPFFTTRMGRGGTGLGLSISYQIATAVLGGTLRVSSKPGRGSIFILTFPQQAPENVE
ncbi:MAG: Signal-transduction histidine kinase senX3 [Betaproteobacteria bacterium ADurb.Bin341]|nr:MAG: Signal-transduction histidine kinase senX3 [Betaproteobacteria bacterium ADurb.Bin341]